MSDPRGANPLGRYPGAQFRCLVCRRFVTATAQGICPRCGYAPPVLTDTPASVAEPDPVARQRMTSLHQEAPKAAMQMAIAILILLLVICPLILTIKYSD